MTAPIDYLGRQIDLSAWHGQKASGDTLLTPTIGGAEGSGEALSGPLKLAQQFLIELLTIKGSKRGFPDEGTTFIEKLRNGYLRTSLEAEQAFRSAVLDIRRNLAVTYDASVPNDERLEDVQLIGTAIQGDTLIIRARLITVAGTTRVILFPLATVLTTGVTG